jgi:hypothetical protein
MRPSQRADGWKHYPYREIFGEEPKNISDILPRFQEVHIKYKMAAPDEPTNTCREFGKTPSAKYL